jgi:hypothetical protein
MGRLRVRDSSDSDWLDICKSEFYTRNATNTGWIRILPSRGLKVRHGTNNFWINIDCISDEECVPDVYGGTPDGEGTNGSGPGLALPPDVGYPGDTDGSQNNGVFDPWEPETYVPPNEISEDGSYEGPSDVPPTEVLPTDEVLGNEGGTSDTPQNPSYDDVDAGSSTEGEGGEGDYSASEGTYEPGYDMPDSGGENAGLQTNEEGEACIYRPSTNECETYDETNGCGSDASGGTYDEPYSCPSSVEGCSEKIITEFYVDLGEVTGQVDIAYNIREGRGSIDVYYAGTRRASTYGKVEGAEYLPFQFDSAEGGGETKIFVRVRIDEGTQWTVAIPCPGPKEEIGTLVNPAPCKGTFEPTHGGGSGVQEVVHDMGPDAGEVVIEYQMWNLPDRMDILYRGGVVASTSGPVAGTGLLSFFYNPVGEDNLITLRVTSYDGDTSWVYLLNCPGEAGSAITPKICDPEIPNQSGGAGVTDTYYNLGTVAGNVQVTYQMWNVPDQMDIYQGDTLLASTGVVSGEDILNFDYDPLLGDVIRVRMTGEQRGTSWAFLMDCPYDAPTVTVSPASIDITEGSAGSTQQCFDLTIEEAATREIRVDYSTEDGTAESVAGTSYVLAEDSNNNTFIGAFEAPSGGRVVFDGGFPKFYDSSWIRTVTYNSMESQGKYLVNILNWIKDTNKVAAGNTDVLFLGDSNAGESYNVKEAFVSIFTDCATAAGLNPVFKTRSDYGDIPMLIPTSEIDTYCAVVVMSSQTSNVGAQRLTPATSDYLKSFVSSGSGMCIITDHDIFQTLGNELAAKFNATFSGDVDRVPVLVNDLVAEFGAHPLWDNMTGETLEASTSEGNIAVGTFTFDFVSIAGTVTIPVGGTGTQICIDITADTEDEADENFTLVLSNPRNAILATETVNINILDDDAFGEVSITAVAPVVLEGDSGNTAVQATISLTAAIFNPVTVNYTTSDGTAVSGSDYDAATGQVTIPAGQTSTTLTITQIHGDSSVEGDETFNMVISNPVNATLGTSSALITITNDDILSVISCGTAYSDSSDSVSNVLLTGQNDGYSLIEYATTNNNLSGTGERITASYGGGIDADTGGVVLRGENSGFGALIVPTSSGTDDIEVTAPGASTYWRHTTHCPAAYPTAIGWSKFIQGIPNAVEASADLSVGAGVKRISTIASTLVDGRTLRASCTMINVTNGSLLIRGYADDLARVFLVNAGGSYNQEVAQLTIGGITDTPVTVSPGIYFVYVYVENTNSTASASWLSMQISDNGTIISATTNDWFMDVFETGEVYGAGNTANINTLDALIYDSDLAANTYTGANTAPTISDIFNTWPRTTGVSYFANGGVATGDASDWFFATSPDRFVMPTNVAAPNQIVSETSFSNYNFNGTLTSDNSDDDSIGLVIAFARVSSVNYSLVVVRNHAGNAPTSGFGLLFITGNTIEVITQHPMQGQTNQNGGGTGDGTGWSNRQTRVEVTRTGNTFQYRVSDWNNLTSFSSMFSLDLSSDARFSVFNTAAQIGFYTYSQPGSTYLDVDMPDSPESRVLSVDTGTIWEAINGVWVNQGSGLNFSDHLGGWPLYVTNPETGDSYHVGPTTTRKN